jgi:uncharacterized protein (DUF58 family)
MTRDRLSYLLLLAGIFILHVMLVDYLSSFVFLFFLLLPGVSLLVTAAFCRDSLVVIKTGAVTAAKGDLLSIEVSVTNPSWLPVRTRVELLIHNELTGDAERELLVLMTGRRGGSVTQALSFARAGRVRLSIERTGVYDLLGLVCLKTKRANRMSAGILVLPDIVETAGIGSDGGALHDIENDGLMQVVKGDDPSELYDIREYRPGDRVTRIHWKLSDKSGRLMVKELGRVLAGDALVMLDLNGGAEEADALLTAFASVSSSLARAGVSHDVEWYAARRRELRKDHIASKADSDRVVASILGEGGLTDAPYVLRSKLRSGGRNPYARALCLCSSAGVDDADLNALTAQMAAPGMSVVLVGRETAAKAASAGPHAQTAAAGPFPRILRVSPRGIAAALEEAVL